MSLIGSKAPDWSGAAYHNGEQQPLSSSDYAGKWHVMYWYPLDFTWVCPTEIRGFQSLLGEFAGDSVELIGASTDSFYSHQAWFCDRQIFRARTVRNTSAGLRPTFTSLTWKARTMPVSSITTDARYAMPACSLRTSKARLIEWLVSASTGCVIASGKRAAVFAPLIGTRATASCSNGGIV